MKLATPYISERVFVFKNKRIFIFIVIAGIISLNLWANETQVSSQQDKKNKSVKSQNKVDINFEDEVIKGDNNVPEMLLVNSRKLVKYKDLFNKRTDFIDEVESNKDLFNDYRK